MKKDVWEEYIRSVTPIDNSNKYVTPLQALHYSANLEKLRRSRQQQYLINLESNANREVRLFTRNQKKRFKSESTLDLHDEFDNIDAALNNFCTRCIINNIKFITIITGKGRGIVLHNVIEWLKEHTYLIGEYFEITDSTNACGSLGVRLKTYRSLI